MNQPISTKCYTVWGPWGSKDSDSIPLLAISQVNKWKSRTNVIIMKVVNARLCVLHKMHGLPRKTFAIYRIE